MWVYMGIFWISKNQKFIVETVWERQTCSLIAVEPTVYGWAAGSNRFNIVQEHHHHGGGEPEQHHHHHQQHHHHHQAASHIRDTHTALNKFLPQQRPLNHSIEGKYVKEFLWDYFTKKLFSPQVEVFPSALRFYSITQWSCSAPGSLWKMQDSNSGPNEPPHLQNEPPHLLN